MRIVIGVIVAAFWLMAATGASAQQFYMGIQSGLNIAHDSEIEQGGSSVDLEYFPGAALSLYAGYHFDFGLRLEGEFAFRDNEAKSLDGIDVDGNVFSTAFMANLFYEFDTGSKFAPYLGAGFGFATVVVDNLEFEDFFFELADDSDTAFAYQFGGGFAIRFNRTVAFTTDLRFFGTSELEMVDAGGSEFTASYFTTSLRAGVRLSF